MGATYFYVNYDKKQYFNIGILGYGNKRNNLGRTAAARAMSLMMSDEKYWKNNRMGVIDDTSNETEYELIRQEYTNIDIDAMLLLFGIDNLDEYADHLENSANFVLLSELAINLQDEKINRYLQKIYGKDWQVKYRKLVNTKDYKSYVLKIFEYQERHQLTTAST